MIIKLIDKTKRSALIASSAGRLSRTKGSVNDVINMSSMKSKEENENFISKVVNMGHTSIIDHVYFNFSIENVTPVIEQLLIASRYCSVTIKSRREANFGEKKYYIPIFKTENGTILDNSKIENIYKKNMNNLFDTYKILVDKGIKMEDARYILPYSFYSQILFGADATELIRIINMFMYGPYSHIDEVYEFGNRLYEELVKEAPYIDDVLKNVKFKDEDCIKNLIKKNVALKAKNLDLVIPLNENEFKEIDKTIALNSLMRTMQLPIDIAKKELNDICLNDKKFMKKLFCAINEDCNKSDLKSINLNFQISVSLANLTHLTRHRGLSLSIPDFIPNFNFDNYIVPDSIKGDKQLLKIFNDAYNENLNNYNKLKDYGVREEDLVYFSLSCNLVNIVANIDGLNFKHMSSVRCCRKAQWEVRSIVNAMVDKISEHSEYYSKIIGANCAVIGICPEKFESCKNPYPNKKLED